MKQIRRNCFETNSSSSHSLVVRSDEIVHETEETEYYTHDEMLDECWKIDENGVLDASDECWYFGRAPFRPLYRFADKFKYAIANCGTKEDIEELLELLRELVPEVKEVVFPKDYGIGVDDYALDSWLHRRGVDMKDFLTNKKYVIIQDGDEYCIWSDLVKLGIIDKKAAGIVCEDENNEK